MYRNMYMHRNLNNMSKLKLSGNTDNLILFWPLHFLHQPSVGFPVLQFRAAINKLGKSWDFVPTDVTLAAMHCILGLGIGVQLQ